MGQLGAANSQLVLLTMLHFHRIPVGGSTGAFETLANGASALVKVIKSIPRYGQKGNQHNYDGNCQNQ